MKVQLTTIISTIVWLALLLTGCETYQPAKVVVIYEIDVNGYADSTYNGGKSFFILPGNEVSVGSLEFREFAGCVARGLSRVGFTEATNAMHADLIVLLVYGIGERQQQTQVRQMPIWGLSGGSANYSSTTYGLYGSTRTEGVISQPLRPEIIGTVPRYDTETTYLRWVNLKAFDMQKYQRDKQEVEVWNTTIQSRGRSGDLRAVFPYMIAGSYQAFGRNTGGFKRTTVNEGSWTP